MPKDPRLARESVSGYSARSALREANKEKW